MDLNRREAIGLGFGAGIAALFGKWFPKKWHTWTPTKPYYSGPIAKAAQWEFMDCTTMMPFTRRDYLADAVWQIYNRSPFICQLIEYSGDESIEEEARINFMRS